jgi:two-component system cell cycle sensor histidine kinase/response regulator CckA
MLEGLVPPEEVELLEMMRESADTAAETARSLMTFSRQSRNENETCFPSQVAKNMSRRARKLFDSDVQIQWELEETPAVGMGAAQLEEVLLHLLLNAKASSPLNSVVTVRVSEIHANVQVEVADTGVGIPDHIIDRVFEPFFTTKGEQATGLGLALVWGHVQRCGGDVHVTSEVNVGTTFTFTLPTEKTQNE